MAWASDVRIPEVRRLHVEVHLAALRAVDRDRVEVERVLGRELEPDRGRARAPRRVQPVKRHVFARRAVAVVDEPPRRRGDGGRERGGGVRGDDGRFSRAHVVLVLHEVPTLAVRVRVEARAPRRCRGRCAPGGRGRRRGRARGRPRTREAPCASSGRRRPGAGPRETGESFSGDCVAVEQRVALERCTSTSTENFGSPLSGGTCAQSITGAGAGPFHWTSTFPTTAPRPRSGTRSREGAIPRTGGRQHGHGQARRFRRRRQAADARGGHVRDLSLVAAAPAVAGDGSRQREPPSRRCRRRPAWRRAACGSVERHEAPRRARRRLEMRLERLRRGRAEAASGSCRGSRRTRRA